MRLERGNAYTEIIGAPTWFLDLARRKLAIPVEPTQKLSARIGAVFWHEGAPWGSLVHWSQTGGRVGAGLTVYIERLAHVNKLPCEVRDVRTKPATNYPLHSVQVQWRPYQDEAHRAMVRCSTGVIVATPRAGKTLLAARIVDTLSLPTLYIAPTVAIVKQTHEVFCRHFGEDLCSRLDGEATPGQRDLSKLIVISTAQSAVHQSSDWLKTRKVLVLDEAHRDASETYHKISAKAENAYYRYCLTGTWARTGDKDTLAMEAICSQVIYRIGVADLVPNYLAPPRLCYLPIRGHKIDAIDWREAYENGIVDYEPRNELIVRAAKGLALDRGIPTIVLVRRRRHADSLGERIPESVVVKGGEGMLTSQSVRDFLDGKHQVLIGTTVLGEGVDVPRAGALVFASGGGPGVMQVQSYFRPLTAHPGKDVARIYDFQDKHHPTLRRHARERSRLAQQYLGTNCLVDL